MTAFITSLRVEILVVILSAYILYKLWQVRKFSGNLNRFFVYAAAMTLFSIANLLSSMGDEHIAFQSMVSSYCVTAFYMISLCFGAYTWFMYAESATESSWADTGRKRALWAIPAAVFAGLCISAPFNGWMYTVDEAGTYQRGSLWFLQFVFCYSYMIIAIVKVVVFRFRNRDRHEKADRVLIWNTVILFAGCILQIFFAHAYVAIGATFGIIFSYAELCTEEEREISEKAALKALVEKTEQQRKELQIALDNYKQADYDRRTDYLTGLRNRQDMFEMLRDSLSGKREMITAMYMIDIDNFKQLNDRYGHLYGDECLKRIGQELIEYGAQNEIWFYRYGGEEIIGIGTGSKVSARAHAERIVRRIEKLGIRRDDMPAGAVTVSLGYTTNNSRYEKMIDMADKAMYEAKAAGKNRAVCYDSENKL